MLDTDAGLTPLYLSTIAVQTRRRLRQHRRSEIKTDEDDCENENDKRL